MPLRKEPPTPRSAAVDARLDPTSNSNAAGSSLTPLIPFKPGQTSLRKQAILTEDEYTSALSSIIKRDFFPELDRITAENEYLAAVESEEPERIRVALNRLLRFDRHGSQSAGKQKQKDATGSTPVARSERGEWDDTPIAGSSSRVFNPTFTPAAASTPGLSQVGQPQEPEISSGITPDLDLSLSDFQGRYTSEDNASFSQLLDRDNQVRKRKHAHLFAREIASEQRRKHIIHTEQRDAQKGRQLAIEANPGHPKLLLEQAKQTLLIEGSKPEESEKATAPEHSAKDPMDDLILVPEPRHDDRPASMGLNRWKYTARNPLMYAADANESYLHAHPSSSSAATNDQPKPETNFTALRIPGESDPLTEPDKESEPGWSPSSSRIDAAIHRGRSGSFTSTADETPKVNGYGFVTPYSTPQHTVTHPDDAHLRIYNAIKAKQRADAPAPAGEGFQLQHLGKREELAQKLASSASPAATPYGRAKYTGLQGLKMRAFASPRRKAGELTPAARALLDRSTRGTAPTPARHSTPSARPAKRITDRGWTPTPRR
ncbi:related to protein DGCR14, probably involved in pre-mRNA splicing [Sporisorium reilianum f. sp. reilianum]|uniref:Related to protein DGCR14, probably involved in pre-mRNA splicing n=1 Tax=Sporisorium reilianum f. sp. reilianum TaxID=72559 RepID=A0A2N8U7L8_9BASI|nr:related to protein DGCR14, probably involved in pre-mRNA splicing [Sporisorium reilianum f. sp. reilianum]